MQVEIKITTEVRETPGAMPQPSLLDHESNCLQQKSIKEIAMY